MKNKYIYSLFIVFLFICLTGCGSNNQEKEDNKETNEKTVQEDNKELVDNMNNIVKSFLDKADNGEYYELDAIYKVEDKLKEERLGNYKFIAFCDKEYKEKPNLEIFVINGDQLPNYDGNCTYSTWNFYNEKYNKGDDRYLLILDNDTKNYYSVRVSFKKKNIGNNNRYYPIFSDSILLK